MKECTYTGKDLSKIYKAFVCNEVISTTVYQVSSVNKNFHKKYTAKQLANTTLAFVSYRPFNSYCEQNLKLQKMRKFPKCKRNPTYGMT